ncbi:MAG TPA: DUF6600 domain-containing protein [Verrucomicrobiae bacterium]|nr:DUF6600 domain-containing protein [Verrucomicrobiae bacterium]
MKMLFHPCLAGVVAVVGLLGLGTGRVAADLEVSASVSIHAAADFYEPLTPHGAWIEVGSYGRCWHPAHVAVEWRPYCDGSWVWTDCGWYWESDEPWGWACYHYGTWVLDPVHSWIWVPGIEWAPAWVSWRVGGGYCGWAPLAPRGVVIAPAAFVFVENSRIHERLQPRNVIVNNTTIINKTTVIQNGIVRETRTIGDAGPKRVVVNNGPGVEPLRASGRQVRTVAIQEAVRQTAVPQEVTRRAAQPRNEPARTEPTRTEPNRNEPNRNEPNRNEPNRNEPNRNEPNRNQPGRTEPGHPAPGVQPGRVEPRRDPPKRNEPSRNEATRNEAAQPSDLAAPERHPDPSPATPRELKRPEQPQPAPAAPERERPHVPARPLPDHQPGPAVPAPAARAPYPQRGYLHRGPDVQPRPAQPQQHAPHQPSQPHQGQEKDRGQDML